MREEKEKLKEQIEQLKRQIENNSELRLNVERDSMILRAKVESYQINIEELEKLRRQHISLHDELNKLKSENTECSALNKELLRQRDQYKEEFVRIKETLDNERKHLEEFKVQSEKNLIKLKNCIEEERYDFRDKLLSLEREVLKCKKEKDETKAKYRQYASIADKLQSKLEDMKEQQKIETKKQTTHQNKSSQPLVGTVPLEVHNQLKKELKLMKKKQNELSQLLNCTFDSTHCKEVNQTHD
jgi:chromosome segregation ATPase